MIELLDTRSGNVIGRYALASQAIKVIEDELEAGGDVSDLAVISWTRRKPRVIARSHDIARRRQPGAPSESYVATFVRRISSAPLAWPMTSNAVTATVVQSRAGVAAAR